jgi:methylase of polypeptide subunit release factors
MAEAETTEWEIVALAAGWMNSLFEAHRQASPLKQCRVEKRTSGSLKRRDMTILDEDGRARVTGEAKLPWAPDGHSPFVDSVVRDARDKAAREGVDLFFTWNINQLVLWRRSALEAGDRGYQLFDIANVVKEGQPLSPIVEAQIRDGVERFTLKLIELVRENQPLPLRSPDDYFVQALESFLKRPIGETKWALLERDKDKAKAAQIDRWMREDQGWTLGLDRADDIERAAKFACYATVNKLVFYEALKKRFTRMPALRFTSGVRTSDEALDQVDAFFSRAKRFSGDYETIFGFDRRDFGNRIPFLSAGAVEGWRGVLEHVDKFDFTQLDYDVIGRIFEKLIAPEERHKYGQYYTRPEVVDLINAFCIRNGDDRVFDPGCGGGTFLVRAYARKKYLQPDLGHRELIARIFGTDISHFAAHLATINLATRELIDERNYPRIQRADFFETAPDDKLIELPDDDGEGTAILPGRFDAIVANPPYVRQEDIGKARKTMMASLVKRDAKLMANGRSDLHVYFWGHSFAFLKQGARLGFLTSSQWLDVEYGFALQEWLLNHFKILAIAESHAEPWFQGARVATAATIAEREDDAEARNSNIVRFVELRRPIADLVGRNGSRDMLLGAEALRDRILATNDDTTTPDWRIRVVPQRELLEKGLALGERVKGKRLYLGGKWGIPLRAPDLWFDLLAAGGDRWRALGELADIARGITSGCDDFFYVRDISIKSLERFAGTNEFREHYGVARNRVDTGDAAIAETGTGEAFPIERRFLEPIVHSLMHVDRYEIAPNNCERLALMVSSEESLRGTLVGRYIAWGEQQRYNLGATCAARESDLGHRWYDLTGARVAPLFWAKSHQYRHCAPRNAIGVLANCNLYTVELSEDQIDVAFGVLNSSLAILSKHLHGRPVGVEANLKTEVVDVNMMLVPDWTRASAPVAARIQAAGRQLRQRGVLGMLSDRRLRAKSLLERNRGSDLDNLSDVTEFDCEDRQELDDAVLELLGIVSVRRRTDLRQQLYEHLRSYFEKERRKEEEAIDNKRQAKMRSRQTPDTLAQAVFDLIHEQDPLLLRSYEDLADRYGHDALDDARFIPRPDQVKLQDDLLGSGLFYRSTRTGTRELVRARHGAQAELMLEIALLGEGDDTYFLPSDPELCRKLAGQLREHREARERKAREILKDRTADPDLIEKALALTMARFRRFAPASA